MDALWGFLENAAILVGGLAVRFAVAAVLLGVLVALLLPFLYAGEGLRRTLMRLGGFGSVSGLSWRRDTYYSPAHAWLRARAGQLRIGLDDLAGRLLRRVDRVQLPEVGAYLKEGDALLTMETGQRGVVIPAPVEGTVLRVNARLEEQPDAIVQDPYRSGWIVEIQPAGDRYRALRRNEEARAWLAREAARLSLALEHATGIVAADGGDLTVPTHLLITEEKRAELERQFLQTL
ncbi:MAG TPA: hypothetical protein VK886_16215 [Vicinamibacterales bacterium]|nr:hypothetical protein [Vicinamibacterales bacterium]